MVGGWVAQLALPAPVCLSPPVSLTNQVRGTQQHFVFSLWPSDNEAVVWRRSRTNARPDRLTELLFRQRCGTVGSTAGSVLGGDGTRMG